jgi:hypothetical protein
MGILAASTVFDCAKIYLENACLKDINPSLPGNYDALASTLFAAFAVETFLNERLEDTNGKPLMKLIKQDKQRMPTKLRLLSEYFSDEPISGSDSLYEDYSLLHNIRNRCVHVEPGDDIDAPIVKHTDIFEKLDKKGIKKSFRVTIMDDAEIFTGFINEMSRREIADWACKTASGIINLFIDRMRSSKTKELLESYKGSFTYDYHETVKRTSDLYKKILESRNAVILENPTEINGINDLVDKIISGEIIISFPKAKAN